MSNSANSQSDHTLHVKLVEDHKRLQREVAKLEGKLKRIEIALDEHCVCEEGRMCSYCAILEEGRAR